MKAIFSTDAVDPQYRFDYWHSIACRKIISHDSEPEARVGFQAEMSAGLLAGIEFIDFANSPMTVLHRKQHVSAADPEEFFICCQSGGGLLVEQNMREAQLERGDMTFLDPRLPYSGRFTGASRMLLLKVPRRSLEIRIGSVSGMGACRIRPSRAEDKLTSAFLALLSEHVGQLGSSSEELIGSQLLDLVALAIASARQPGGERPRLSSARSLVRFRLRAAVEARLADPELGPASAARAAGVSVRYANAVLAEEATSISRLIQERRLARCRAALADPLQAHRKISEIAYGWGFADMSHFGRVFRRTYDLSPSEYRKRHSGAGLKPEPASSTSSSASGVSA